MNLLLKIKASMQRYFSGTFPLGALLIAMLVAGGACSGSRGGVKLQELSTPITADSLYPAWEKEYWSKQEYYSYEPSERSGFLKMVIDADSMTTSRWYQKYPVKPFSRYKFSGWIKTEQVVPFREGAGAGFRIGRIEVSGDQIFTGNTPWTLVELEFETGGDDSAMLECLLGKGGRAQGKVYFDEISIELLSSRELSPNVTIDLSQTGEPMSELIYGQFIEHMGKCIYGGIWSEIIEDRKFFYAPGHKNSPWQIIGSQNAIVMDSLNPFVGEYNLAINNSNGAANGIFQDKLGLLEEMGYEGRIILKGSPKAFPLMIELKWGDQQEQSQKLFIEDLPGEGFQTIPIAFFSNATTQNGRITIVAQGDGVVTIGAISLMPVNNIQGFRPDVLALMKKLDAPIYRWPGGNFVSGYNWKDGIGNRDKRPTRFEAAWNGLESNDVGIDEFMILCKLLNSDANIAVNTGLGTPEMAARMVEYVNGPVATRMGSLRAANGHEQPYNVRLWAVGNEMFGDWQLGVMPIEDYVLKHNETSRLMWQVDPDIELIAVGFPGRWNDMMYSHSADYMTYISEHFYRQDWHAGGLMTHVKQIPDAIREIADEHRRARKEIPGIADRDIKIALDEWNYWYGPHVHGLLGTRYFLQDALGIAAGINEFLRQSDIFYMANYAQTVNVIGAIKATNTTSFMEGTGEVLQLYRREFGTIPVEMSGNPAPLDVATALTPDGNFLTISIINPTEHNQDIDLAFAQGNIPKKGKLFYITGSDRYIYNDSGQVEIMERQVDFSLKGNMLSVPPMSACIYKFQLN